MKVVSSILAVIFSFSALADISRPGPARAISSVENNEINEIPNTSSRRIHKALVETFFPFELVEKKMNEAKDPKEKAHLAKVLKKATDLIGPTFDEVRKVEEMKYIHILLSNLGNLTSPVVASIYYGLLTFEVEESKKNLWEETAKIREYCAKLSKEKGIIFLRFDHLTVPERTKLLSMMANSSNNYLRRLSFATKLLYTSKIFKGDLSSLIAGLEVEPHRFDEKFYDSNKKFAPHHLTYNAKKKVIEGELDYIVVGSGVASSVVVNRLHRAGKKVLVLEKGSFIYPGAINARDNFDFLDSNGLRSDNDGSMFFLNGSTVGGGSTVNIDMSYPPTLSYIKNNFEKWRTDGIIPQGMWTQPQLADAQKWIDEVFDVRTIVDEEVNTNNHILLRGALAMGMELAEDQNDMDKGIQKYRLFTNSQTERNYIDGRPIEITDKKSVVEKLLWAPMMNERSHDYDGKVATHPVVLESNATVAKVIHTKNGKSRKAIGVEFEKNQAWNHPGIITDPSGMEIPVGAKVKVYAKNVILSAGNLGTSVILLKSKIKNKNIGRGFTAHPFLPIVGFFDEEVNAHLGTPSTYYIDEYLTKDVNKPRPGFLIESAAGNADLGGVIVPGTATQVYETVEKLKYISGLGVILVEETNPNNRIELIGGKPVIFHNLSEIDRRRFAKGIAEGIRLLFKAGAKKVSFVSYENVFKRKDNSDFKFFTNIEEANLVETNMRFTENQSLIMGAHMLGANKLGTSPEFSVVDPDHQVWGVDGLYVVDASVFPTSPGANPMQSIYAISKLFVDRHLEKEKSSK